MCTIPSNIMPTERLLELDRQLYRAIKDRNSYLLHCSRQGKKITPPGRYRHEYFTKIDYGIDFNTRIYGSKLFNSMTSDYERLELIAARIVSQFNQTVNAGVYYSNSVCITNYTQFLSEIGKTELAGGNGPDMASMLKEMEDAEEHYVDGHKCFKPGKDKMEPYALPTDDFFFGMGYLAYMKDPKEYKELGEPLLNMVGSKDFRELCRPIFFAWCIHVLERLLLDMDPDRSSNEFVENADQMLNAVFFYLYERTDMRPHQMVMDNAIRIMRLASRAGGRPKYWPSHLRIFVTRCLRTRELPFPIQEMCYKMTCAAAWMIGPRFWTSDEQFVRVLAAMCAVHWRLMLEGLAERQPLTHAYSLFLEIFLVCEERHRISDQTAICVAGNCKEMLESIAGYIKGEAQNPQPLSEGHRYTVSALMSSLVATGGFHMIHEDDQKVIVDWWLKHSVEQSDVFRQLMLCSSYVPKLDPRVLSALAAYYERCVTGDVPEEEADMMVFHWVVKLIQDKRTDFYDKSSLSDCVARLERVRTPKKYVDALKKLKC
ncbi:hypothetical protein PMAYCL1PPCAC_01218 [Pristionchus mayeri]|uniref:Uncharacterized protein n=1 Tax=Pristionchus mayeri TaxID=1317129 RepID=A0AAN5BZG4_9BILA|nr:hypothetical protein PMAYCL1PPCAC_01218 [Pristionchus mayeri]